jgi:sugar/nucleoside kinase (ribokinase family)
LADKSYKVVGIGNAVVDVLVNVDDGFLEKHGLTKGGMQLGDEQTADRLYQDMPSGIECSGGSVGNTVAALGALGAKAGYIGKVADDELGLVYAHDMKANGVTFATDRADGQMTTARSLVAVTPDAQRTMYTSLGAAITLSKDDIDTDQIAEAEVLLLEGYLFDSPQANEACHIALPEARKHGTQTAISLSDAGCVERHLEEFRQILDDGLDILFANEEEAKTLSGTGDVWSAIEWLKRDGLIAVVTRSEKGSIVVDGGQLTEVDAVKPAQLEDTTGAGDMYAAGFLYGLTHGWPHADSGALGARLAAEAIAHLGARPRKDIKPLLQQKAA